MSKSNRVPVAWCTARNSDPESSFEAAKRHEPRAASNAGLILAVIRRTSNKLTACELAIASGVDRTETSRRLSDLCRNGFIAKDEMKECSVKQRKMLTWRAI